MRTIIIGDGGHGRVISDIVERIPALTLCGILDEKFSSRELDPQACWPQLIGGVDDLGRLVKTEGVEGVIVAIGDNALRARIVQTVLDAAPTVQFPKVIHPHAQIASGVEIGRGTVVMAGVVVNSGTRIGDFCILNTHCSIDHDCQIGDFASFGPNSCAGGSVDVGEFTAVCLGANIIHNRHIAPHTVVGAGATVVSDLPSHVVAFGSPARPISNRVEGEDYLSSSLTAASREGVSESQESLAARQPD